MKDIFKSYFLKFNLNTTISLISSYFTAASLYTAKYYSLTLDKGPLSSSHHIFSSATLLNSLWAPSSGHFFLVCSFNHLTFLCNIGGDGEDCKMLSVRKLELDKKLSDGHKGFRCFLVARLTFGKNNYSWSTCPTARYSKDNFAARY